MYNKISISLYIGILLLCNALYTGLEIYKFDFREEWVQSGGISDQVFTTLDRLNTWTTFIEFVMLFAVLGVGLILIVRKREKFLMRFVGLNVILLTLFLFIGLMIASMLNLPSGNLTQQVVVPFGMTFIIGMLYGLRILVDKRKVNLEPKI